MYSYAQAETVLARLFGAGNEAAQRGAFRGRLKHLKRLGVPLDVSPGRGKRIQYGIEYIYQWALCLELEEFGLDPTIIVQFVRAYWANMLLGYFYEAADLSEGDLLFHITPRIMSKTWEPPHDSFQRQFPDFADHSPIRSTDTDRLAHHLSGSARRACFVNLSEIVRLARNETIRVCGEA